jgi:SpoVK/Ycf46/Vps4 family AAA+-type ATPase
VTIPDHTWLELNQQYLAEAVATVRRHLSTHVLKVTRQPQPSVSAQRAETSDEQCADILRDISSPPAIEQLCNLFGLSPFERSVLLLCAGMELDAAFGAACAAAQGDPQRGYPTMGLALAALPHAHWNALLPNAPLRSWRLIEFAAGGSAGAPLTTRPLRIDERVLHYLTGIQHLDERLFGLVVQHSAENELMPSHRAIAERIVATWSRSPMQLPLPVIVLHGPDALSARAIAASACVSFGLQLFTLSARALPSTPAELHQFIRLWERESILSPKALLIEFHDHAAENNRDASISEFIDRTSSPVVVVTRERLHFTRRPSGLFEVRRPQPREQRTAWSHALGELAHQLNGELDQLTSQFCLNWVEMQTAATEARSPADSKAKLVALWDACRNQTRSQMEDLAQRIDANADWDDLVLPEMQKGILQDIVAQVRHRSTVYDAWGFSEKSSRGLGISVLFAGASGTGKTMAAEVLARALRLDLFRIDLSSVVSKYIGETEKNIRRVFDAAETGGAVLLFDEADALFGKRSEVRDSHDRYANIEVSYLLQRMESYQGLAILTTNMKSALDTAFLRRIRFVVQFPFPDATQRAQIWRRIFPTKSPIQDIDVHKLSQLNVAGGNIKNMALTAAFLAADENEPISMSHVLRAAKSEYAKLEKSLTDAEVAGWV